MPPNNPRGYKKRRRLTQNQLARLRRVPSTSLTRTQQRAQLARYVASRGGAAVSAVPAMEAAHMAYQAAQHATNIYNKTMGTFARGQKANTRPIKQTRATTRGSAPWKAKLDKRRHEKLKAPQARPLVKGKGYNSTRMGYINTHPNSKIPRWKIERKSKYKNDVWQTVLLSRSNRLTGSNNTLQTTRYPLKMPECLDSERTQTVMFTPFCSHFSGIHTTFYRKVASSGATLDHDFTNRLDVIQHKADTGRLQLLQNVQVNGNTEAINPVYEGPTHSDDVQAASNFTAITTFKDQLVKHIGVDLVFIASRAFPVEVSVSVVRAIKPQTPYTLSTDETRELCNGVQNYGMAWDTWRTEYFHKFTLPGLRVGKKPPHYSVNKILKTNFLQTNTFNENTTSTDMTQAAATSLGSNIHSHIQEVADGNMSGNFYVLIKYRKVQEPQQFTYKQTIDAASNSVSTGNNFPATQIELPVLTEESFDVPAVDGDGLTDSGTDANSGKPFSTNQGDESKASFYLNGKLTYAWGFKEETEPIPAIMSNVKANANWKKAQSLNIDPTVDPTDDNNGIYCQSSDHVNITASTANNGI